MHTLTPSTKPQTIHGKSNPSSRNSPPRRQRPAKQSSERSDTGPRIRPLGDLLDDDTIKPREQLCGSWLLERGLTMVFAPTGVGKSWFSLGIAAAVATGGSFGHWDAPRASRVLYIDGEMDVSDLKLRFKLTIAAASGGDIDLIGENITLYARHDQPEDDTNFPDFGSLDHAERILSIVHQVRPQLVVLDNLSTLATVDDDNAADAWDNFLKLLQKIKAAGTAVLVVHHANKNGDQYRGSSKIPVMFDALVRLRPDAQVYGSGGAAFLLDFTKTRMQTDDSRKTFKVSFANECWQWNTLVDPMIVELVQRIREGEFVTQAEAAKAIEKSTGEISKMLRRAYTAGITTPQEIAEALQAARDDAREAAVNHDDF